MESIETLNKRLIEHFGIDSDGGGPIFRIVWSDDQLEKRLIDEVAGIRLLYPEVREVKKYPYIQHMYVLERLVIVPDPNIQDLPTQMKSYEPIWTYCNNRQEALPPIWDATKLVVDTLYAALGKKDMSNYIKDGKDDTPEEKEKRVNKLHEELFGNETETADALRYREGIVVPSNYDKH